MDDNRHEQAKAMRKAGLTYAEIGKALHVSRQRAQQLVRYTPGNYLHVSALRKIPYKGLREWMLANEVGFEKLSRLCECETNRAAMGRGCNKYTIDAILRVTGLDYETCFKEG